MVPSSIELVYDKPLLNWILSHKSSQTEPNTLFVGISAPQGIGKTSLTTRFIKTLAQTNLNAVSVSIDDFYKTHAELSTLSHNFPGNPFFCGRGLPGTHDLELYTQFISSITNKDSHPVVIPRYDKSLHCGQGDRLPEDQWEVVQKPIDIVFVEGWMLGFAPVKSCLVECPNLQQVNEFLSNYGIWRDSFDLFIHLDAERPEFFEKWRREAEENQQRAGKGHMTEEALDAFINKFKPCYDLYVPALRSNYPTVPCLRVVIGENRMPLEWFAV
ncbi:hypothetical protein RCL1_002394 [Eukaryota sp. TZLM3-RCL]